GRGAYRRALIVLIAWLAGVGAAVGLGLGFGGSLQDSFSIPGTESQAAIDQLAAVFPQSAGAVGQVVVQDPAGGVLEDDHLAAIDRFIAQAEDIDFVEAVISPFSEYATAAVNDDGSTAIIQVS